MVDREADLSCEAVFQRTPKNGITSWRLGIDVFHMFVISFIFLAWTMHLPLAVVSDVTLSPRKAVERCDILSLHTKITAAPKKTYSPKYNRPARTFCLDDSSSARAF
jgi:hypothetical protein